MVEFPSIRLPLRTLLIGASAALAFGAPCSGASGTVARCSTTQLRIAPTFYGEAGGQFLQTFTFRNTSVRACRLRGWPRLDIRTVHVRQGAPTAPVLRTVVLRSRAAASFDVYGEDWNHLADKPCAYTHAIRVTPPGNSSALRVSVRLPHCGRLYVAPVIAGTKDREAWSTVVP